MHYPSLQANSASTSHHQGGGGSGPSAGGPNTGGVGSGMKNQPGNNAAGQGQQQHPQVVKDLLDRVHEEFTHLQQQLQHARVELEKGQQERDSMQRYAMMVNKLFSRELGAIKYREIRNF
jgi:hypothetical protein